jgi:selT/selW/selH-like putative selenoprotein
LAAELKNEFGVQARLIRGGGGIYDVTVDGEVVFSKFRAGRFPDPGEVAKILRRLAPE